MPSDFSHDALTSGVVALMEDEIERIREKFLNLRHHVSGYEPTLVSLLNDVEWAIVDAMQTEELNTYERESILYHLRAAACGTLRAGEKNGKKAVR